MHAFSNLINKSWHPSYNSWLILTFSSFIHVLIKLLHMSVVLFICLTLLSISCVSALCMISVPLSVLMLLFNLKLTGVIFWLKHLRVNLLWFLKSASFLTWCSHFLNMATLTLPNSFLIILCRFLILFILSNNDSSSVFSLNRINSYFFTSFHQATYSGFLKCEGKC